MTAGAVQCHNTFMWSDVATALSVAGDVHSRANDSKTQLSLDYIMVENYGFVLSEPSPSIAGWVNPLLAQCTPASLNHSCTNTGLLVDHAGTGEWDGGTTGDGAFRHGIEFEPLCNIYGLWSDGAFRTSPAAPSDSRTGMWLGVINAQMIYQLVFQIEFPEWQPASGPSAGWLQTVQVPIWGAEVAALAPGILAPFGSVPQLEVVVVEGTPLRQVTPRVINGPVIRAHAWMEPCADLCAHIVVASFDQGAPAQFTVRVEGMGDMLPADGIDATRLFDASYNVTLESDGSLHDHIGAGATNVYEVGCHGPRPAVQMTAHPVGAAWQACANRRLTCTNGFVHRDGAQMPSPHMGACGVYP